MVSTGSATRRLLAILVFGACASGLAAQIKVVTTIPDLADLARWIGGDKVVAKSLTKGHEDMHQVRIRPSLLIKVRRADVFVELGMDAEHAWVPALLRNGRNRKVRPGGKGFCNASVGVKPLRVPKDKTRGAGPDVHPRGNPHYNLDPRRMDQAAQNIHDTLVAVAPGDRALFGAGLKKWRAELAKRKKVWHKRLAPFRKAEFLEAHDSWVYFAEAFDLRIAGRLEPRPGLAPTPRHLAAMMKLAKERKIGLVLSQARNAASAKRVAKSCGGKAIVLQLGSATSGPTKGWFAFMDHAVETFAKSLRKAK